MSESESVALNRSMPLCKLAPFRWPVCQPAFDLCLLSAQSLLCCLALTASTPSRGSACVNPYSCCGAGRAPKRRAPLQRGRAPLEPPQRFGQRAQPAVRGRGRLRRRPALRLWRRRDWSARADWISESERERASERASAVRVCGSERGGQGGRQRGGTAKRSERASELKSASENVIEGEGKARDIGDRAGSAGKARERRC